MKTQDIRTLKILEEIEAGEAPSQRDLAGKLNVSLGLVNSFIKRLAQKGYFKVATIPRNRVKYMLTPKGAAEKARLTYEYVQYSIQFYKRARDRTSDLFSGLADSGVSRVAFCGAGELAEIAFLSLQEAGMELVCVIDENWPRRRFMGAPVIGPGRISSIDCGAFVITSADRPDEFSEILAQNGVASDKVRMLSVI